MNIVTFASLASGDIFRQFNAKGELAEKCIKLSACYEDGSPVFLGTGTEPFKNRPVNAALLEPMKRASVTPEQWYPAGTVVKCLGNEAVVKWYADWDAKPAAEAESSGACVVCEQRTTPGPCPSCK